MSKQWDADILITPEIAAIVINQQFPALRPVSVKPFAEGWDNAVYVVNELHLFRFPRRELVLEVLDNAVRILPQLAPELAIPVPMPQFIGEASPDFPYPFFGYRKMSGQSASELRLPDSARAALAAPLGRFLSVLHSHLDVAEDCDIPVDPYNKAKPSRILERISKAYDATRHYFDTTQTAAFDRIIAETPQKINVPYVLTHGDFYSRHLLIDAQTHAWTGVIDWDDIHIGHPALDLSIGWSFLPRASLETFLEAYGGVDTETYHLCRTKALFYGLVLLDYGLDTKDDALAWEARWILDRVQEQD